MGACAPAECGAPDFHKCNINKLFFSQKKIRATCDCNSDPLAPRVVQVRFGVDIFSKASTTSTIILAVEASKMSPNWPFVVCGVPP
jgi:hypothetical protein